MHPELDFHFFEIAAYAFFTCAAFGLVILGSFLFASKRGFAQADAAWMLGGMSIAALVGARLFNLIVNLDWYREDPARFFALNFSGFSLYGGILFALVAGFFVSRWRKIPLLKFADTTAPFVGLGIATMRVGCFLAGCCFGKETDLPWGVSFPLMSPAHMHQINEHILNSLAVSPVHPTQLYEFAAALAASGLAFWMIKRKYADGMAAFAAMGIFSAFRLINMRFRELPYSEGITEIFYPLFYVAIIAVCAIWVAKILRHTRANA